MRTITKTDRQIVEYKNHQRQLSHYEREQKPLNQTKYDKLSACQSQRNHFLTRKIRALRQQLRID
jgi:hypothetical protein